MKKKFIYVVLILIFAILCLLAIYKVKNRNSDIYDYHVESREERDGRYDGEPENVVYVVDGVGNELRVEVLSCELLDDSEIADSEYMPEFFKEYPEYPTYEEYIDIEGLSAANSEFAKYYKDPNAYGINEGLALFENNKELVDKFRKSRQQNRKYIFVKTKINITQRYAPHNNISLSSITCCVSTIDKKYNYTATDTICYFDKPINTEGFDREKQYFFYNFDAVNPLECTIGFVVDDIEEYGNCEYFIGDWDQNLLDGSLGPNMIKVYSSY